MWESKFEDRLKKIENVVSKILLLLEQNIDKQNGRVPAIEEKDSIMTVKEVSSFLNMNVNLIYAKCTKGDLPYFRIGKGYRFKKQDVIRWLNMQATNTNKPGLSVESYVNNYLQKNQLRS